MNEVKVGIIGIGNMGSAHLHSVTADNILGMSVTAVCDINPEKLKAAKAKYPDIVAFGGGKLMRRSEEKRQGICYYV